MNTADNFYMDEFKIKRQALNTFVINTPYPIDTLSTSPKISKPFSIPKDISLDFPLIGKYFIRVLLAGLITMLTICCFVLCFLTPTQIENSFLLKSTKNLTNKKLILTNKVQEVSSYRNLFAVSSSLKLTEPEEIIHIKNATTPVSNIKQVNPLHIQYAGF